VKSRVIQMTKKFRLALQPGYWADRAQHLPSATAPVNMLGVLQLTDFIQIGSVSYSQMREDR